MADALANFLRSPTRRGRTVTGEIKSRKRELSRRSGPSEAHLQMRNVNRSCTAEVVIIRQLESEGLVRMPLQDKRLVDMCEEALQAGAIFGAAIP